MRLPEQRMWDRLRDAMQGRWTYERIENKITKGTPDVAFSMEGKRGWIELKVIDHWPGKRILPVRIPHFTREQKRFLSLHHRTGGGGCYLFLLIAETSEYLLFTGARAGAVGFLSRDEMYANAVVIFRGMPGGLELKSNILQYWED